MHKREALKLKAGDLVAWGESMWSARVDQGGGWIYGKVLHVTPNGGIKVRPLGVIENDDQRAWKTPGAAEWVPYHHVHQGITII